VPPTKRENGCQVMFQISLFVIAGITGRNLRQVSTLRFNEKFARKYMVARNRGSLRTVGAQQSLKALRHSDYLNFCSFDARYMGQSAQTTSDDCFKERVEWSARPCASATGAATASYVGKERPARVVLLTECSMSDNVALQYPDLEFVRPCNLCPHMKRITLPKIRRSLEEMTHEVTVDAVIADRARRTVERMLAMG
jgi:hypothetical protein